MSDELKNELKNDNQTGGFERFNLPDSLMQAIDALGFTRCTPIQEKILPLTLLGHDAIGQAQTGTGKTAVFLITLINDLLKSPPEEKRYIGEPRAVVIAPTRELAQQIDSDARNLSKFCDLNPLLLIGGEPLEKQRRANAQQITDILIATPGRLLDMVEQQELDLSMVQMLVIDEADRMLDMGFIPQVRRVIRRLPPVENRQTLLFSATLEKSLMWMIEKWTHKPVRIEVKPEAIATDNVRQHIYTVTSDKKYLLLLNLLRDENTENAIIFANRRTTVHKLHSKLSSDGVKCGRMAGDITQSEREKTLRRFRNGELKYLIATDVAGRGLHIDDISHVINYNLPEEPKDYVHRIGRTGRAGKKGSSISLACEEDALRLPPITELLGYQPDCSPPPNNI